MSKPSASSPPSETVCTHTVEVGKTVLSLDLVDSQLDLSERLLLILVEVGERKLKDSTLEGIVGVLCEWTKGRARQGEGDARMRGQEEEGKGTHSIPGIG